LQVCRLQKDIGTGVICKVEKGAYCRAERELRLLLFNNQLVMIGDRAVVFAERHTQVEMGFALRELGIWVIALQRVEKITVLIKSVSSRGGIARFNSSRFF
jgi:hypothetical protein